MFNSCCFNAKRGSIGWNDVFLFSITKDFRQCKRIILVAGARLLWHIEQERNQSCRPLGPRTTRYRVVTGARSFVPLRSLTRRSFPPRNRTVLNYFEKAFRFLGYTNTKGPIGQDWILCAERIIESCCVLMTDELGRPRPFCHAE